jgi:hypothetical protein
VVEWSRALDVRLSEWDIGGPLKTVKHCSRNYMVNSLTNSYGTWTDHIIIIIYNIYIVHYLIKIILRAQHDLKKRVQ